MDILILSGDEESAAREYLQQRRVNELFQSLTVGLLQHRPADPRQYLLDCLQHIHRVGWQNVFWDTFLPKGRCSSGLSAIERQKGTEEQGLIREQNKNVKIEQIELRLTDDKDVAQIQTKKKSRPAILRAATGTQVSEDVRNAQAGYDVPMLRVMEGSLENLPAMPTNTVRIFLSSTFSDFKAERNILPRLAYPELSAFCREHGLDFQVVDMRWGVTDDVINDHQVAELCIKEIALCQQVSCGPNFVALLGDRYGHRPFPAKIEAAEFEMLAARTKTSDESAYSLLMDWFWKDSNAVPEAYVLQPIQSKLRDYNETAPERESLQAEDRRKWKDIFARLRSCLEMAAKGAVTAGDLDEEHSEKYYISVTEREVQCGLSQRDDVAYRALCYTRHLNGIEGWDATDRWVSRFIDLTPDGEIDRLAMDMCTALRETKVPTKIPSRKPRSYETKWTGTPLEDSTEEGHTVYLEKFCQDFVADMKAEISANLLSMAISKRKEAEVLYSEVLHHAKFAQHKCEIFCGREEAVKKIETYLKDSKQQRHPLVISGKSGYGKTSLLAYAAKCLPEWLSGENIVVLRFLGTTPQCSNIYNTLKSVIDQICVALNYPPYRDIEKMGDVRRSLWSLLQKVGSQNPEKRLVLILDSVDQLSETYGAHRMVWLPRVLPSNVFLLVSMLSDRYDCLANTKLRLSDENSYCELQPLSTSTAEDIIIAYMNLHKRKLTTQQSALVTEVFTQCRQPLFLKLVLDSAGAWNSYTPLDSISVAASVHEAITQLFESLEGMYGQIFVQKSLGYLTCGCGGLTSLEMEDVLSCDNDVLVQVYQYHDPPLEGTIRIPSLMWSRLQHALREYLAERQVHGKSVLTWYHRQFWETAEGRYAGTLSTKRALHGTLAEIFAQEDGIRRTIVLQKRGGKVLENADRRVALQPLTVQNVRKLGCLPHHLLHSGNIEELTSRCLVNFKWMLTKLQAVGVAELFEEYMSIMADLELGGSKMVKLMCDFTELCHDALHFDPALLAFHALEWLRDLKQDDAQHPMVRGFVTDAQKWKEESQEPLLWPTYRMNFAGLDTPLDFTMMVGSDGVLSADEKIIICSMTELKTNDHSLQCLALDAKDILSTTKIPKDSPVAIYRENHFFYMHFQKLKLCEIDSGELTKEIYFGDKEYDLVTPRCMTLSKDQCYLAFGVKFGKPAKAKEGDTWKTTCFVYIVDLTNLKKPVTTKISFSGKKLVDNMWFAEEDRYLVCCSRDRMIVHSVPSLDIVHHLEKVQLIYGPTCQLIETAQCIAGGVKQSHGSRLLLYWYQDNSFILSKKLNVDDNIVDETVEPFSVASKDDLSLMVLGVMTEMRDVRRACLWLWSRSGESGNADDETYAQIAIGTGIWKLPNIMRVTNDWLYAVVGWRNGDMSVVSLEQKLELLNLDHAHGHTINLAHIINHGNRLITMSTDNNLKMWNLECLKKNANAATRASAAKEPADSPKMQLLDENEQVLDVTVLKDCVLTANQLNVDSPRFWDLHTGSLMRELTEKHDVIYKKSLQTSEADVTNRCHANLEMHGDILLYTRRRRSCSIFYVLKNIRNPEILTHQFVQNMFFHLVPEIGRAISNRDGQPEIIIVKDGSVEIRDLATFQVLRTIEMPNISEEVGNIESQAGKRKLMYMKVALTFDGKYFLILNPVGTKARGGRCFHLVDLEAGHYRGKYPLTNGNSFYFLVKREEESGPQIVFPSAMPKLDDGEQYEYKSLIYFRPNDQSFLSFDGSLGFEFTHKFSARLWQVEPLKKLHSLYGHIAGMTGSISRDNRLFGTGSYDNTVRLWSVASGQQLCMFHMYGAISDVMFTPQGSHLIVHCYAAPQRKRAAILEIKNIQNTDREHQK